MPKVMGILNVTPDSFYDGGRFTTNDAILAQVGKMIKAGADMIDVGGYSTRPGADEIPEEEEIKRVVNAIKLTLEVYPETIISVDTFRSQVARRAIDAGASMINDITGGEFDSKMFATMADLRVPYILMHTRGTPKTMNQLNVYDNLLKEIVDFFHARIRMLEDLKVTDIIVDPGFGFAKNVKQNFELLSGLDYLAILGKPIMVGLSRKSMIWRTLESTPEDALNGTTALNTVALSNGADIIRVHDVAEARECVQLWSQIPNGKRSYQS
jgi:dihydropteroate synthase